MASWSMIFKVFVNLSAVKCLSQLFVFRLKCLTKICCKLSVRKGFKLNSCSRSKLPAVSCLSDILFATIKFFFSYVKSNMFWHLGRMNLTFQDIPHICHIFVYSEDFIKKYFFLYFLWNFRLLKNYLGSSSYIFLRSNT